MATVYGPSAERVREALRFLETGFGGSSVHLTVLCDFAKAHLPKTRIVEVWRVEYATPGFGDNEWLCLTRTYRKEADAHTGALSGNGLPGNARCIRVTGPHKYEVPA